ncbi:MAG: pyruvate kinase, partial [Blautia sp.]
MKRTKIICTLGPATDQGDVLEELVKNGMDIARFNFSHGDHQEHKGRMNKLKTIRDELSLPIATVLDTKGPEIRTGLLKDGKKVCLKTGQEFVLTLGDYVGDEHKVAISYQGLCQDVEPGNTILMD